MRLKIANLYGKTVRHVVTVRYAMKYGIILHLRSKNKLACLLKQVRCQCM